MGIFCCPQILVVLLLCAFVGCGAPPPSVPMISVKGVLKVGGKPIPNVEVQLIPNEMSHDSMVSTGRTNSDGKFNLAATNGRQGAAKGKYKIVLSPPAKSEQESLTAPPKDASLEQIVAHQKKYVSQKPPKPGHKQGEDEDSVIPKDFMKKETTPRQLEVVDKPLEIELDL